MAFSRSWVIAAVVVLVLLTLWLCVPSVPCGGGRPLAGFWVGEPRFLERSGLRDMFLYLEASGRGYVLMANEDGDVVANQSFVWRAAPQLWAWGRKGAQRGALRFVHDEGDPELPYPGHLRYVFSPEGGALTLHDNQQVYAHLQRDNVASVGAADAAE